MQSYLELIASGRVNLDALIDRVITVDEATAAYKALAGAAGTPPLGVLIRYPDDARELPEPADATRITVRGHKPPNPELINYALVGAGAFGMAMLVPQMKKRKDRYFLRGVVTRNNAQGGNFARENGVEVLASELKTVLDDPSFHLMVIATRHHEHVGPVIESLKAGKHVFVEKPLAITWQGLDDVVKAYNSLEHKPLLMVGFNRRFSPAVTEIKKAVAGRRAPLMIEYRLNGGYIPMDSWVQGAQGGGRNIGEACHMYDVFRSLTGSPVRSISATSIDPGHAPVPAERQLLRDDRLRGRQRGHARLHRARAQDRHEQGAHRGVLRRRRVRRGQLPEAHARERRARDVAEQRARQGARRGVQPPR